MARSRSRSHAPLRPAVKSPLRPPQDEHEERRVRQKVQRLQEIALTHLEWAHERTAAAMEAGKHEDADCHSMSASLWLGRLAGHG